MDPHHLLDRFGQSKEAGWEEAKTGEAGCSAGKTVGTDNAEMLQSDIRPVMYLLSLAG